MSNTNIDAGIYSITHIETGRVYIGSSKHLTKRWKEHVYLLERNKHFNIKLQSAWSIYGKDAFVYSILALIDTHDERLAQEQLYLDNLKPHYNISLSAIAPMSGRKMPESFSEGLSKRFKGRVFTKEHLAKIVASNAGFRHSEETKSKIALIRTGTKSSPETCKKVSEAMKGRYISPEHRSKLSASLKGHPVSAETKAKIAATRLAKKLLLIDSMPKEEGVKNHIKYAKNKTPEHLEKIRQGIILSWKRRKEQKECGTE